MPGMLKKERIELMEKIEQCCLEFEDDLKGIFYRLEDISESDKKLIQYIMPNQKDEGSFEQLAG